MSDGEWNRGVPSGVALHRTAADLRRDLEALLAKADVRERYAPSSPIISGDPWCWSFNEALRAERLELRARYTEWVEIAERQVGKLNPEALPEFDRHSPVVLSPLNLADSGPGPGSDLPQEAATRVLEAFDDIVKALRSVVGDAGTPSRSEAPWLVPDTNALLKAPTLSDWAAKGAGTLILVPQVLRELDHHKQHHRVESVKEKAQKLHRQFNDFERRGDTTVGVKIADQLMFREIAVDAPVKESLSWLRSNHADDQLLASVLDLAWRHPQAAITLVTEDRALLNKARQAGLTTDRAPFDKSVDATKPPARPRNRPIVRVKSVSVDHKLSVVSSLDTAWPQEPLSVLAIALVNAGSASAFNIGGSLFFIHSGGAEERIGPFEVPVLEPHGSYSLQFNRRHPGWPAPVGPGSVRIEGTCVDDGGVEFDIGDERASPEKGSNR
jgi:hypothetical protein